MKRTIAFLICFVLLVSAFVSCSDTETPSAPEQTSDPAGAQSVSAESAEESAAHSQEGMSPEAAARVAELSALYKGPLPEGYAMRDIARGCSYTYAHDPHKSMPDSGGKLTDGRSCTVDSNDWVGFLGRDDLVVILDLGGLKNDLCGASINVLYSETSGRNVPKTCEFWISENGEDFTLLGTSARYPGVYNGNFVFTHAYYAQGTFSASYVKVVIKDFISIWTCIDDLCVYDIHGAAAGEVIDSYYKNEPMPVNVEPEYWDDTEDLTSTVNLIAGLKQRIYEGVRIAGEIETEYYNTPASSKLLTNGRRASSNSYGDEEYFHITRAISRRIVYDIGRISSVERAVVGLYTAEEAGISTPDKISVLVSEDGEVWQTVASLEHGEYPSFDTKRGDIVLEFGAKYKARFVRFDLVVSSHVWVDELEAFGTKGVSEDALTVVADPPESSLNRYNDPADIGGCENILLAYTYIPNSLSSGRVTKEKYVPYVAYVDTEGNILDTFFDSYLFLPCVRELASGAYLTSGSTVPSVMTDWIAYREDVFWENANVNALEQAAAEVDEALGGNTEKLNVFFTILGPNKKAVSFGDVDGDGISENLSKSEDRKKVVKWWIDSYIERFNAGNYEHLDLKGFYWYDESVGVDDELRGTLAYASEYVHSMGYYLIWIPYHQASGFSEWKELGFDAANMQPNYMFHEKDTVQVVYTNAELCSQYGMGVEIEMDGRALIEDEYHKRYVEYLSVGAEKGYMNGVKMYYQDGCPGLLYKCASGNASNRKLYDLTYKYAKGTLSAELGDIDGYEFAVEKNKPYVGALSADGIQCGNVELVLSPRYGSVSISQSGDIRYVPLEGYVGEDEFTVIASDGVAGSKVTVYVTVAESAPGSGE